MATRSAWNAANLRPDERPYGCISAMDAQLDRYASSEAIPTACGGVDVEKFDLFDELFKCRRRQSSGAGRNFTFNLPDNLLCFLAAAVDE